MAELSESQKQTLKAYILADPVLSTKVSGPGTDYAGITDALNALAVPDFWGWRTSVSHSEIVTATSGDGTTWSWPAFIARSQGERDGWRQIFADGPINASLASVRQAFADIFSGSQNNAPAQRAHLLAIGRRKARVAEKLLASGTGSTASPATFVMDGSIHMTQIADILAA